MVVHCSRRRRRPETSIVRRSWWFQTRFPTVRASCPATIVHRIERGTQFPFGRSKNAQEAGLAQRDIQTHSRFEAVLTTRTRGGKVPTGNLQRALKQPGRAANERHWGIRPSRNESRQSCRCLASQTPKSTVLWHWLGTQCLRFHRGKCDGKLSERNQQGWKYI